MISFHKTLLLRLTSTGLQFLIGLIIASWAGTNEFGGIAFMITNGALFIIFTNLGGDASLIWFGASKKIDPATSVALAYRLAFFQGMIYLILLFCNTLIADTLWISHQSLHSWPYECLYIFGLIIGDKFISLFYARQNSLQLNLLQASVAFFLIMLLVAIHEKWLPWSCSVFQTFTGFSFFQSFLLLLFYHYSYGLKSLRIKDYSMLRSLWHFSLLVFFTNLIQFFAYRLDYWFLEAMKGMSALGIYAQACRFSQLLWVLPQALATLLIPELLLKDLQQQKQLILKALRLVLFVSLILFPIVLLISTFIYSNWMPAFSVGLAVIIFLLCGSLLFGLSIIAASYFSAKGKLWVNFSCSLLCFVILFLGDVLLIPKYGVDGAAFATCLAYASSSLIYLHLLKKYMDFEWSILWEFSYQELFSWISFKKSVIE